MPDGTTEPLQTAADLDQWCTRHLDENNGARHNVRHDGIKDRMVSANLPKHTAVTEMTSLTPTAAYLIRLGAEATSAERDAYETRKDDVTVQDLSSGRVQKLISLVTRHARWSRNEFGATIDT